MGLRQVIEKGFTDRANISRMESYETEKGETRQRLTLVYTAEPCRISQKSLSINSQRETFNEISYETKLFISPDVEVKQGDTITITRGTIVRTYKAGEPFVYHTHQEVSLQRSEKA
ncbi:ABC transporter ATP-binding protein [Schinkia azotoformans]|uniref:ABC transporter ATP-binding protein n=1 Tax=Schinkia azotoformans TaxID=1454 RepID=UPI002E23CD00|nr:ABC transporter ATP-binding protein [Schinkia azotoformans]